MNLLNRLQNIDSRLLYLLLALVVSVPLIFPIPAGKAVVLPQSRSFFDSVERVTGDPVAQKKLVIVSFSFSASTATENLSQADAILRHLMARRMKIALFSFSDPQGRDLAQGLAERIAPEYGYQYGRDYVNWGYKSGDPAPNIKSLSRDIYGTIGKDIKGTPLAQIPLMQNYKSVNDVAMVVEISSVSSLEYWLGYFAAAGENRIPINYGCTAVMAPEAFPFLKSGQISGLLNGLTGAGEYEALILQAKYATQPGFGSRASASLSFAHFLIILLIVVGNVSMIVLRRQQAAAAAREAR
ncbi:MAG: hypothetical protein H7Z41_03260 [Cytophagales bacterium]|nr:hypothetical protein [Armatimonadota bacterium]